MFNKNRRRWNQNKIVNEEGYQVYKMRDDQALFLEASSFTPRNSFYHTTKDRLMNFESLIDRLIVSDIKFVLALTWFLGKVMGVRLAPVIMTMRLAENTGHQLQKIVKDVFTRPDFIANAFGYWKHQKGEIKSFPRDIFQLLKKQLESFNEVTLKNRKMLHREFKLKDLIKILKPMPKDAKRSKFYRAIIEDGKASKLSVEIDEKTGKVKKADHVTAAISDNRVSHAAKKKFVQESMKNIPINALIKNLSFLTDEDAPVLKERLEAIFKSGDGLRFVNPFDLILLESLHFRGYNTEVRVNQSILNILDQILKKYVSFELSAQKPVILYDRSGSMAGEGHRTGSKFLALVDNLFSKDYKFYTFASSRWDQCGESETPAAIVDVTEHFKDLHDGPNMIARHIQSSIKCYGGTELLEAAKWTVSQNPEMDLFIIITDEVTWAESVNIEIHRRIIPDHLAGKVLLINVAPAQKSVFKPTAKIVRISGLDGKILQMVKAITDFDQFKKDIIARFEKV